MKILMLLAAMFGPTSALAADTPIGIKDPKVFEVQLREMGYAPDPFDLTGVGKTVTTVLHLPNETLALVLAGCTMGRDCRYAVVVGSFSDVAKPSAKWVATMNADYDMIKTWVRDDGKLAYSAGAIVEGMPRATFKAWIDIVVESTDDLASEAIKAGYGPKDAKK